MAKEKTLQDLFHDTLRDIYFAEKKILQSLPKMRRAANNEKLQNAFEKHREQTEDQIARLEKVFEIIDKSARGKTCEAIKGIIDEAEELMADFKDTPALDAALISSAQAVEHYEIARYGTLCRWAKELGMKDAADLLNQTLQEENQTDKDLTKLAEATVNEAAQPAKAS